MKRKFVFQQFSGAPKYISGMRLVHLQEDFDNKSGMLLLLISFHTEVSLDF